MKALIERPCLRRHRLLLARLRLAELLRPVVAAREQLRVAVLDRANIRRLVLGCIEAKFFKYM